MKLNKIAATVFATMALMAGAAHAEDTTTTTTTTVNGGTIHFTGELVNAACSVSTKSSDQTVELGQYRTADFPTVGSVSATKGFEIVLNDCDPEVSKTASVAFSGQTDGTSPDLLAIASADNGSTASGVAIEILDTTSKALSPNGAVYSTAQALIDGTNTLHFSAHYKSTSATVTAGQANADATFIMKYE
ncbi:type 1 fimbrial protein subunit FimA [Metakosakonia massiliensis]|uniref:Type-1 fimbrial protein, A chain n=1 Tax=Phytobacter massiliensis TaxID=1485952 RepID=A0A6N2ZPA1_9ENTR|nr:type 1 fimbrial major subunit FimA [Phytobacter massiliensis]